MISFNITPLTHDLSNDLFEVINNKTKPIGSLGKLEKIAHQIGLIQNTLSPELIKPTMVIFAGDHGVAESGVSPYPQVVTQQMVLNFLNGGAAINVFCEQHNIDIKIVDSGVNASFESHPKLINAKIANGTNNYLNGSAMTPEQCTQALEHAATIVKDIFEQDCNIIGFGEMGIANTSSAAILMSVLCELPIEKCVGRGTGLNNAGLLRKTKTLKQALAFHNLPGKKLSAFEALTLFGGFEIAMLSGAILKAAELGMTILIDGFIASAAALAATKINKNCLDYCIFTHESNEQGHRLMLNLLNVGTVVKLDMRLGEGSGVAVTYPLIQSAVNFLTKMASFESANVNQQ